MKGRATLPVCSCFHRTHCTPPADRPSGQTHVCTTITRINIMLFCCVFACNVTRACQSAGREGWVPRPAGCDQSQRRERCPIFNLLPMNSTVKESFSFTVLPWVVELSLLCLFSHRPSSLRSIQDAKQFPAIGLTIDRKSCYEKPSSQRLGLSTSELLSRGAAIAK